RGEPLRADAGGAPGHRAASIEGGKGIARESPRREPIGALMLVIDGSAGLAESSGGLFAAIFAIPPGTRVGAIIASEPIQQVPLAPWSAGQRYAVVKLVHATRFTGGQDNAPALAPAPRVLGAQ